MKKIVIHKPGGFQQLKIEDAESPKPTSKEVKIKVSAIGINYADVVIRWGLYKSAKQFVGWPITPGFEVSGTVEDIGDEVKGFVKGDKVFAVTLFNGYSTEICIPDHQVFHIPSNIGMEEAAGIPAVYLTAYHAIFQNIIIRADRDALVHSAAGGVGSAIVQLLKIIGCNITGVVGSSSKVARLEELGVDHIIDKSKYDLWSKIDDVKPEGFDLIFDGNGGKSLKEGYKRTKIGGKVVVYGTHSILPRKSGTINWIKLIYSFLTAATFHSLKLNSRSIINFNLSFMFHEKELLKEAMADLCKWLEEDKIKPLNITTFPFEKVQDAHRAIQSGRTTGKLILLT